jgi:arylsulfatase A-like enzyme
MAKSLDDSVGKIVEALTRSNKLKDTIIVFTIDNGGATQFSFSGIISADMASNYPLRSVSRFYFN